MEELNLEGVFWLETMPDDQVAGRLTFDAVNGAELDLIGSFHSLQKLFNELERPVRIHGIAGGKALTLLDCLRTNMSIQVPGITSEKYRASVILSGCHLNESQPQVFDAVRVKFRHLDSWVGKTGTVVDTSSDEQSTRTRKIQITHTPLEKEAVPTDIGELELIFTYGLNRDPFNTITLTHSATLGIQFTEQRTLRDTFGISTALRSLITIGVDAPAFITEASLTHSNFVRALPKGKESPIPIGLYNQELGDTTQGEVKNIYPTQMLFTFEDIGGLDGVAKWLKTSAKFRLVIDSLMSHWYLPTIYTNDRLLNMIIAAEALHRIRIKKQKFNFRDALINLAVLAGDPFKAIVRDVESWAKEVVQARINHLVHRGLHGNLEGKRMYDLSESLYFLVVLCLLRECGIPEETLSKMQNHRRFGWVSEQLRSAS